jgi:hypothetical protein
MSTIDKLLRRDLEQVARDNNDLQALHMIHVWQRGRIASLLGLFCSLILVTTSMLQVSGLVGRPMPWPLWALFSAAFIGCMLAAWLSWRWLR